MTKIKPRVIIYKKDRINYIIEGVCHFYNLPKEEVLKKKARSPELYTAKRMLIKLLRDVADCSFKDIRYAFTYGDEANGWMIYSKLSEDLDAGGTINKEIKQEYADLLKSMEL